MAHFRGTLRGSGAYISRLGSKSSGLEVNATSWEGAVAVTLYHNSEADQDYALVSLVPHYGAGIVKELYHGPVSGTRVRSHKRRK